MRIELSQTSVAAQFYSGSQTANNRQESLRTEHGGHHRHRVDHDDPASPSSGARRLQGVKRHGHDNPMRALDKLTGRLLKSMMQAFTGREFNLVRPDPLAGTGAWTTGNPAATAPSDAGTAAASPSGNALAAYYQVQSFSLSFSASATVQTEDGQQLGISVQFSYSQQSYAAAAIAGGTAGKDTATAPIHTEFQGVAAQLTRTSFDFELDFGGRPASAAPVETSGGGGTPPAAAHPSGDDSENPMLEQLDRLFEKLRVWLRQADGSRQLIAYGLNSTTAVYLGTAGGAPADAGTATSAADNDQAPTLDTVA